MAKNIMGGAKADAEGCGARREADDKAGGKSDG